MRIQKKRIRKLEPNLPGVKPGTHVIVAFPVEQAEASGLARAGFMPAPPVGESVLPSVVGPVTRYNAEGRMIIHRDKPKETCYRQHEWTYTQCHGRDRIEVTDIVDVPYQRYPRTLVPPPSIALTIARLADGGTVIAAPAVPFESARPEALCLSINLMLELFGGCDVLDESLAPLGVVPTQAVNWQILPPGKMPWEALKPALDKVIQAQKKGNRPVVEYRLKVISDYQPEFVAVGRGGFTGYLVFGFPTLGLYVLECACYGNATYVLAKGWEDLSQLTKAQLLDGQLHRARFVHIAHWTDRIRDLLKGAARGPAA